MHIWKKNVTFAKHIQFLLLHNELPQTEQLKQHPFINLEFYRSKVQHMWLGCLLRVSQSLVKMSARLNLWRL